MGYLMFGAYLHSDFIHKLLSEVMSYQAKMSSHNENQLY